MFSIFIFGGTTEGRELAEFCVENKINACVSVTTEYGAELLPMSNYLHVLTGKMSYEEMMTTLAQMQISLVIDATHPYAVEVTKNISLACDTNSIEKIRVIRNEDAVCNNGRYFDNAKLLTDYLNTKDGNILITTGSKELFVFCSVKNYADRCAVRVLCIDTIVDECLKLGYKKENIISEKGPFTVEQNISHLSCYNAKYLVTKDSGATGGFYEKTKAAKKYGAELLVIKRPVENGITLEKTKKILLMEKKFER